MKSNSSNLPALRIALVSGGLPCGGSTTFLVNFAAGLARRNIPVEVLSFEKDNPLAADFSHSDVPVFAQDKHRLIFEDQLQAILRRMSRFDPTVVLANLSSVSFEVLRYVPAGVFRAGIIHTDHGREYTLVRHYAAHMDMLAAVSKRIKLNIDGMPEFGGLPSRHIPLGVFLPTEANVARVELDRPLRIFYLGRLEREQKRAHLFPQIFEQLKESGIPFHWTIAGDGPEKCALERAMQNVPGQTVSFAGQIPHKRVPELLQAHDIFLLASNYEGLPLSLLEAMGAGLVPVVSDLPSGIPEVVDAGNGMLVPPDDVAGYARAIIHLHGHRDELAAKSAAARARVQTEFSVAAMTDRWLSAFPKNLPVIGAWPSQWNIKAPLPARHPIYFSPPVRLLRRLAAMLRQ